MWPWFANFVCTLEKLITAEFAPWCTNTKIFTHKRNQSLAQKKKLGFQTTNQNNVARKDFWRLTPSKWPSSWDSGFTAEKQIKVWHCHATCGHQNKTTYIFISIVYAYNRESWVTLIFSSFAEHGGGRIYFRRKWSCVQIEHVPRCQLVKFDTTQEPGRRASGSAVARESTTDRLYVRRKEEEMIFPVFHRIVAASFCECGAARTVNYYIS